jgi:hypothetical protein
MKLIYIILLLSFIAPKCFSEVIEFSQLKTTPDRVERSKNWRQNTKLKSYGDALEGSISVVLMGGIERPGIYYLKVGSTLNDLLRLCGSLDEMASKKILITNFNTGDLIEFQMEAHLKNDVIFTSTKRFLLSEEDNVFIPVIIK